MSDVDYTIIVNDDYIAAPYEAVSPCVTLRNNVNGYVERIGVSASRLI